MFFVIADIADFFMSNQLLVYIADFRFFLFFCKTIMNYNTDTKYIWPVGLTMYIACFEVTEYESVVELMLARQCIILKKYSTYMLNLKLYDLWDYSHNEPPKLKY